LEFRIKYFFYLKNILSIPFYKIKFIFLFKFKTYCTLDTSNKYVNQKIYPDFLQIENAIANVEPLAVKFCQGKGLDIGCGKYKLLNARGIENLSNENAYSINEKDNSQDFIFSSHMLEHLERPYDALNEFIRVLKKNGILFLYLPHPACKIWHVENNPYHLNTPSPHSLSEILVAKFGCSIEFITYLPDAYYSFAIVAKKI
jgi:SAM-dependent methyltransferase